MSPPSVLAPSALRSRSREPAGHSHQRVGRRGKVGPKPDLGRAAVAQFAEPAEGLHPAEDLLGAFAYPLADLEARVASGARIHPRTAAHLISRRYVRPIRESIWSKTEDSRRSSALASILMVLWPAAHGLSVSMRSAG